MSTANNNASGSSSLRPAWYRGAGNQGGRGFQPPPTVTSDRGTETRSGRSGSLGAEPKRDSNKFSALQDDDDVVVAGGNGKSDQQDPKPVANSRSEAFRSSFGRGSGGKTGRSLADLAARVPETSNTRGASGGYGASRFSSIRSSGDTIPAASSSGAADTYKPDAKVVRYTREKLLSIRPRPKHEGEFTPPHLKHVDGTVILSKVPQDPVCWDTFDAEEIWAQSSRDRRGLQAPKLGGPRGLDAADGAKRGFAAPMGRWQRGVALPPPDENIRKGGKEREASNPNDLWDDPIGGATGAAADFSSFGAIPDDPKHTPPGGAPGGPSPGPDESDAFDFGKMAEASREFDKEIHGEKGPEEGDEEDPNLNAHSIKVDPHRPLASVGTTIRSGSGEDVNVFEDFDTPSESEAEPEVAPLKLGDEDPTASSRLMKMIGVGQDEPEHTDASGSGDPVAPVTQPVAPVGPVASEDKEISTDLPKDISPWAISVSDHEGTPLAAASQSAADSLVAAIGSSTSSIPLNPWGDPIVPTGNPQSQPVGTGMDIAARLEAFAAEQKVREAAELEQKELLRRKQEQEEAQRRAMAQQQAQERARQQAQVAAMQQQAASAQSQVELVLMERISAILENSWGRSDLVSILTTLHQEDSRVIPLLGNVDLLRDLIAHNSRRVALRHDPAFGTEMAVLLMTNAQWQQQQQQQQQQQEAQARAQQEELRRREQQQRMEDMQKQAQARAQPNKPPTVIPDAPWYYSDPQNNIQGPFRGDEMRQWLEAGYFKGDLPISQQPSGPFNPLSVIFPDLSVAFKNVSQESAEEEAAALAAAQAAQAAAAAEAAAREEEQRRAQQWEQERLMAEKAKAEAEAKEAEERLRQEREAAAKANANGANESSAQLKMMLGLSSEQKTAEEAMPQEQPIDDNAPVEKIVEKRGSKSTNKNNQRRANKELNASSDQPSGTSTKSAPAPAPAPSPVPVPVPVPATSAWGSAAKSATAKKSMSEIQREEARAAAILAMQKETVPRQSSSGWANIAASGGGSSGWQSGTVKPTSAVVSNANAGGNARMASKQQGMQTATNRKAVGPAPQTRSSSSSNTAAEEFGASMSPALEKWCKDQMQKLKSTDDLTLVSFCMTLNDPVEIRQYLTTYLGATPQVNNFATEFINRIGGGKAKQEEWETPGSAKKGRKKKGSR